MIRILVTGAAGQLASCIKEVSADYISKMRFEYRTSAALDITDKNAVAQEFTAAAYDFCINCAAYTNVDGAESNQERADAVNHLGPKNLADACLKSDTVFIHISTDFVFNGSVSLPYTENDDPHGLGVYGATKLLGEEGIKAVCEKYFIIRTSWLYSEYGHNFMKSMLKYGKERDQLSIVYDQIGTPTYAKDLAVVLMMLIDKDIRAYGTYHYSNEGVASWYDFAMAIFEINHIAVEVRPIRSSAYPLPAKRPSYSVLDKSKIKEALQLEIPYWKTSLAIASAALKKQTRVTN